MSESYVYRRQIVMYKEDPVLKGLKVYVGYTEITLLERDVYFLLLKQNWTKIF